VKAFSIEGELFCSPFESNCWVVDGGSFIYINFQFLYHVLRNGTATRWWSA